jgi:hypothetical protein
MVKIFAGSSAGDGEKFMKPTAIAIDNNANLFIADHNNYKIKKIAQE